jgi:hypothetical protein
MTEHAASDGVRCPYWCGFDRTGTGWCRCGGVYGDACIIRLEAKAIKTESRHD